MHLLTGSDKSTLYLFNLLIKPVVVTMPTISLLSSLTGNWSQFELLISEIASEQEVLMFKNWHSFSSKFAIMCS